MGQTVASRIKATPRSVWSLVTAREKVEPGLESGIPLLHIVDHLQMKVKAAIREKIANQDLHLFAIQPQRKLWYWCNSQKNYV